MLTKTEVFVIVIMIIALIFVIYDMGQGRNWSL